MNPFETQLHTTAQTIHLSTDEKVLMREKMIQYMEMKPIRTVQIEKASVMPTWFSVHEFTKFARARLAPALMAALLVISTSAGVSYAAEDALPGDTLYPVKVGVNEQVVSALMFSETARIAWLSQLAERRLEEASILTMQGRFDVEKGKEVALRFAEHTAALQAKTRELEKSDPAAAAQASADTATTLEAHEAIIARLAVEKDTTAPQAADLVGQVRVAAKAFARLSEDAEEKAFDMNASTTGEAGSATSATRASSSQTGATLKENLVIRMRTTARSNIDEAYALLGRIANQQSDSALNTKKRIGAIEAAFTESDELLARGEYNQAYRAFKGVAADARTITRLLDAEVMFQIEILPSSENGTTSTGIPVGDMSGEATSLQDTQVAKTRTRAQTAIANVQKIILENGHPTDDAVRAVNTLKEAKALALRGDIAVVTKDNSDALYLFRQALEMTQRATDLLRNVQGQHNDGLPTTSPNAPSSTLPDVSSLPPLDVVQVHHIYNEGGHTYSGVFVTPTTCFTLDAQTAVAESAPEQVTLTLKTTETNTHCPQQQLDEKPFSVAAQASKSAVLERVVLNGLPTKFVLIEDGASTSSSTSNASSVLPFLDR